MDIAGLRPPALPRAFVVRSVVEPRTRPVLDGVGRTLGHRQPWWNRPVRPDEGRASTFAAHSLGPVHTPGRCGRIATRQRKRRQTLVGGRQDAAEQTRAAAAARMILGELAPHWSQEVGTELEEQDAPGKRSKAKKSGKPEIHTRVSVFENKIQNTNVNDQLVVVDSELVVVALQPQSVPFDGSAMQARKNRIIELIK